MNDVQGDIRALTTEVAELKRQLKGRKGEVNANTNRATFNVNAGGIGVWVASIACAVMLGVNLFLSVLVINHDRKIDELNQYLTAVYMMAPHLRPKDQK